MPALVSLDDKIWVWHYENKGPAKLPGTQCGIFEDLFIYYLSYTSHHEGWETGAVDIVTNVKIHISDTVKIVNTIHDTTTLRVIDVRNFLYHFKHAYADMLQKCTTGISMQDVTVEVFAKATSFPEGENTTPLPRIMRHVF